MNEHDPYPAESHASETAQAAPPRRRRFGALAWIAVVLGVVGLAGSPVVLLNLLTAGVATVGLVLGVIALFGSRKALALTGVSLCVLANAVTVVFQQRLADDLGSSPRAAATEKPTTSTEPLTWGERYTWEGGLSVEVSEPTDCLGGTFTNGELPADADRPVMLRIKIINNTPLEFDATMLDLSTEARFAGRPIKRYFSESMVMDWGCARDLRGVTTVLEGSALTYPITYDVTEKPGELRLTFSPYPTQNPAVFVGEA
ncbi:hypothetical protein B0I33_103424 [Prauserella shujinwangii]|uniref:DUF4352 domain-containing protein n=1 Tax=Prauserella shujinwangii TaxID=1453103 RepID=A0A2T0LZ44_9PSEU|nr:hypothetical protein [Prauserella shujinwangii]PRX49388.1 hypothetical protein B0I33_103424 [Prauserella shujinwangii]